MMFQNSAAPPEAARLEDYLRGVRRHKWVVIALALLGLALAFLFQSAQTPVYKAESAVALSPTPIGSTDGSRLVSPNLERERAILTSNATATAVIEDLGLATTPEALLANLEVEFRPDSEVLNVSYTSVDPVAAATASNAFSTNYSSRREAEALGYYEAIVTSADQQIAGLQAEAAALGVEISNLQTDRASLIRDEPDPVNRQDQIAVIDTEIIALRAEVSLINTNIRNLDTDKRGAQSDLATRTPAAEVIRSATTPTAPIGIGRNMILVGGLFLGCMLGFVTAFLLERLDTTARDSEDVALALATTVMGAIPTLGIGHRAGPSSLIMLSTGGSARIGAAREAFRRLRSSIQFLNTSSGVSSLIVTSASPSEGKSLTSSNLAIALAQNGSRCVLVSADLRRPTLEKLFGMEGPRPGLSEYLAATAELNAEKVPGINNLWLIRAGTPPSNPGELLNSDRFEQMVKELEREDVEYVVIDTPPVLSTADAVSAARYVDGVIVVVDTERTETSDLLQVRADLERSGSNLIGAVMNRQKFDRGGLFRRDKYAYYRTDR
ncbi:MAG: polysaccharide biosynthesis tyrosine autokinase [Acidimicrobiales bacterium]